MAKLLRAASSCPRCCLLQSGLREVRRQQMARAVLRGPRSDQSMCAQVERPPLYGSHLGREAHTDGPPALPDAPSALAETGTQIFLNGVPDYAAPPGMYRTRFFDAGQEVAPTRIGYRIKIAFGPPPHSCCRRVGPVANVERPGIAARPFLSAERLDLEVHATHPAARGHAAGSGTGVLLRRFGYHGFGGN